MSGKTQINPSVHVTQVNPELGKKTKLNTEIVSGSDSLAAGTVLAEKYEIVRPLGVSAGEADLYICQHEGKQYIAKLYRRQRAVKPEVVAALQQLQSACIAPLIDTGMYHDLPFEVLPYYKNGSLQGKKFSLEELKSRIIPCINEGLRVLHQHDIIHKDLKPSNIMVSDDHQTVAIIDFGISSMVAPGKTVLVTKTGMTPEYSAPETFRNLFLEESDYYSFGITLYELFSGSTPYRNMNAQEIARFTAVQRIPFPEDMPQQLQDLISGMTYFDITNRHNKENPNRRWTYEEVERWCRGEKQVIPGEGTGFGSRWVTPYSFLGEDYEDIPSLVTALATHWEEGKKQLYRGHLSAFFTAFSPEAAKHCTDAEEKATLATGQDDIVFWELLYRLYPELNGFYWMGRIHESLPALGRDMLEKLWRGDEADSAYWDGILDNKLLSHYLTMIRSDNEDLAAAAAAVETAHGLSGRTRRSERMNYYTMAYLLSGQKLFALGEKRLRSVEELRDHMKVLLARSYEALEEFCHSLIDYDDTLDVQLEAWLIALGKRDELEAWRQSLAE